MVDILPNPINPKGSLSTAEEPRCDSSPQQLSLPFYQPPLPPRKSFPIHEDVRESLSAAAAWPSKSSANSEKTSGEPLRGSDFLAHTLRQEWSRSAGTTYSTSNPSTPTAPYWRTILIRAAILLAVIVCLCLVIAL